ncbi:MAG TPA: PsiF family protein [Burkholderiaceae bacterium]
MKSVLTAIALTLAAAGAFAADAGAPAASKALTPQQQKMADCSAANKGKKGDEYKAAQKACLSGGAAPASAPMTQQQKMAACAKQNKGKKGDDYKAAQKACLSAP